MMKTTIATGALCAAFALGTANTMQAASAAPAAGVSMMQQASALPDKGVPEALAQSRSLSIHDVDYVLYINISQDKESQSRGHADISFRIDSPQDVVIDFYDSGSIGEISVNGTTQTTVGTGPCRAADEHIIIPASLLKAGQNTVSLNFGISPRLINHRGNLTYTLSVPDKARRLFPCFDQPDMKATYHLTLSLPEEWQAVSNSPVAATLTENGRTTISFAPTEPLSTYLFAFAAGRFERREMTQDGRTISLYHCETDPARTAQCDEILREVFASLRWLEEYTSIPYPFAKYDLVIIPGFQFGGMEHTGATLYNDRMLFLPEQPTLDERLARTSLIAHETAHMWFGDYVTMKWFGEVWTKEVFANYYAAVISEPLYTDVNHRLRFMLSYAPAAYAEDRTEGANPIQQQLDNLQDAGLIYGNIIYNKSPMMMRQLVEKIGSETFRRGIGRYLRQHAYGNATWDELITTLDSLTSENLTEWSRNWVDEPGTPVYRISRNGRRLTIEQEGIVRQQRIAFMIDGKHYTADCSKCHTHLTIPKGAKTVIANADGMAYGYFAMSDELMEAQLDAIETDDDLARGALLINLHEALWRGDVDADSYISRLTAHLPKEKNALLFSLTAGHLRTAYARHAKSACRELENTLISILMTDTVAARKLTALRTLTAVMDSEEAVQTVEDVWSGKTVISGFTLSDIDAMSISYQLAVRKPAEADSIVARQRLRIKSDNLKQEYDFVSRAVSPRQAERDSLFNLLLTAEGRSVEPWAESALALLNHRCRRDEQMRYVWRGLEALEEVKRTGDIFFPKRWVASLLGGQDPDEAYDIVKRFLDSRPDYPEMLKRKILMNVYSTPSPRSTRCNTSCQLSRQSSTTDN